MKRMLREIEPGQRHYLSPVKSGEETCKVRSPVDHVYSAGFTCTRKKDHEGDHAAHGLNDVQFERWPR